MDAVVQQANKARRAFLEGELERVQALKAQVERQLAEKRSRPSKGAKAPSKGKGAGLKRAGTSLTGESPRGLSRQGHSGAREHQTWTCPGRARVEHISTKHEH